MNPYQTAKSVLLALSLAATILASGAEARITPAALDRTQIQRLVVAEADATSLPPSLPLALAKVESNFRGNALSNKGPAVSCRSCHARRGKNSASRRTNYGIPA